MHAKIRHWADRLIDLSAFFGILGLIVAVVVILIDVVGRNFGAPLKGAQDMSQMAMVLIVFGGMALCDKVGGHISVDIFEPIFPKFVIKIGDIISPLLGAVIFVILAWTVWESSMLSQMLNLATNIIYLPKAWFQYAVIVMSLIAALGMTLRAIEAVIGPAETVNE